MYISIKKAYSECLAGFRHEVSIHIINTYIFLLSIPFQGCHLRKLPPILTFALLRFLYDFKKGERYKVGTGHDQEESVVW